MHITPPTLTVQKFIRYAINLVMDDTIYAAVLPGLRDTAKTYEPLCDWSRGLRGLAESLVELQAALQIRENLEFLPTIVIAASS